MPLFESFEKKERKLALKVMIKHKIIEWNSTKVSLSCHAFFIEGGSYEII